MRTLFIAGEAVLDIAGDRRIDIFPGRFVVTEGNTFIAKIRVPEVGTADMERASIADIGVHVVDI